ncbi:MAG: hypothetical protein NT172_03705 [Planctomycetota bacterium]|nr:hypothetical protein [Planctomycetota bacterium]
MSQNFQIRCQHCQSMVETSQSATKFWVRCGQCGRPVMPRDWSQIIEDPTPTVTFEPINYHLRNDSGNGLSTPTFSALRQAVWKSHLVRRYVLCLITIAGVLAGVAGGFYSGWYLISDVMFSAIMGLGIATMTLLLPELMIGIASGAMSCWFCYFLFGIYGKPTQTLPIYFLFGFCFAVILQIVRSRIMIVVKSSSNLYVDHQQINPAPDLVTSD